VKEVGAFGPLGLQSLLEIFARLASGIDEHTGGPARHDPSPARLGTTGRRAGPKQASCPEIGPRHVPWADFRAGLARQARDQTPGRAAQKPVTKKTSQQISKKF